MKKKLLTGNPLASGVCVLVKPSAEQTDRAVEALTKAIDRAIMKAATDWFPLKKKRRGR